MGISTHVLDLTTGRPAAGLPVHLERQGETGWKSIARAKTNDDGRVPALASELDPGTHRITFDIRAHLGDAAFYPEASIVFRVTEASDHYHIPLLLSPFGYSTYRGS